MKTRTAALFSACYFLALLPLLPVLSLWLDEILELHGVRDVAPGDLAAYIASNAGAVPLGYAPQWAMVRLFGYSPFTGRLASAIFAAISCFLVGMLCRKLKMRRPLLAMAVFALCPIEVRYATEARTYAQATFLALAATLLARLLYEKVTVMRLALYFLTIAAGLYTQPFTLFVALAHLAWLLSERRIRVFTLCAAAIVVAAGAFYPWYAWAAAYWRANMTQEHIRFVFRAHELGLIAHELVGAGYWGTALIAVLALFSRVERRFMALLILLPLLGPLAADRFFGYFLASRQFIFAVPALAIAAAAGAGELLDRHRTAGAAVSCALLAVWIAGDLRWFTKDREDWQRPANVLAQAARAGECVTYVPGASAVYYAFFRPELRGYHCSPSVVRNVWIAVSPYDAEPEYGTEVVHLSREGFRRTEISPGRPRIEHYVR